MKKVLMLALLLALILPAVSADTGPHPSATISFNVTYADGTGTGDFLASIIVCDADDCSIDTSDMCVQGICNFHYYRIERIPSQLELQAKIQGKKFTSDVFNFSWTKSSLNYDAVIGNDGAVILAPSPVQYRKPYEYNGTIGIINESLGNNSNGNVEMSDLASAMIVTIIIELAVAIIMLKRWKIKAKKWKKPLLTIFLADIITVPLVWALFYVLSEAISAIYPWSMLIAIIIAEALAIVAEAYILFAFNKKLLSLKKSFWLSIAMNIASFVIGTLALAVFL